MVLVLCRSLSGGGGTTAPLVWGVLCGDLVAITCSLAGLGAIIATSAALFAAVKWGGVLYLIYLGIKTWRSAPIGRVDAAADDIARGELFREAMVVTALNPKSILFFVAFLPQFVNQSQAVAPQLFLLAITFLVLAGINVFMYCVFSGKIRVLTAQPAAQKKIRRASGSALIFAGVLASVTRAQS